jgi:hypothetical protein
MDLRDNDPELDLGLILQTDGVPTDRQVEVWEIYKRLHLQNQHKMLPIPIYKLNNGQ